MSTRRSLEKCEHFVIYFIETCVRVKGIVVQMDECLRHQHDIPQTTHDDPMVDTHPTPEKHRPIRVQTSVMAPNDVA